MSSEISGNIGIRKWFQRKRANQDARCKVQDAGSRKDAHVEPYATDAAQIGQGVQQEFFYIPS